MVVFGVVLEKIFISTYVYTIASIFVCPIISVIVIHLVLLSFQSIQDTNSPGGRLKPIRTWSTFKTFLGPYVCFSKNPFT